MIKARLLALSLSIFTIAGLFSTNAYSFIDEEETEIGIETKPKTDEISEKAVEPTVLTDKNFKESISEGVVLVDFWAVYCGPCKRQAPIIKELAKDFDGKATIGKLDVQKNRTVAGQYHVRSIPTLIVFKDGKVVERLIGMQSKVTLTDVVNRYL